MAKIPKESLRVGARMAAYGQTWAPAFAFTVMGPVPLGAELVLDFDKPDGSAWIVFRIGLGECGEGEPVAVDDGVTDEELRTRETGDFPFRIRLVSELEGVDEELLSGRYHVSEAGSRNFDTRHDWLLPIGTLAFEAADDEDAPTLEASVFLRGDVNTCDVGGYLFLNGKKLLSSDVRGEVEIASRRDLPSASGVLTERSVREFVLSFPLVKAYVSASDEDMVGWLDLSGAPGTYEVKVTRDHKLERVLGFTVGADGRLVVPGPIVPTNTGGYRIVCPADTPGKLDGDWDRAAAVPDAYYGNPGPPGNEADLSVFYPNFRADG